MRLFGKEQQSEQARKDEALRQKLAGHEVKPPSYLWDGIEEKLPQGKRGRGALLYYVMPIAACIIAAIVFVSIPKGNDAPDNTTLTDKYNTGTTGNDTEDIASTEKGNTSTETPIENQSASAHEIQNSPNTAAYENNRKHNNSTVSHSNFSIKLPSPTVVDNAPVPVLNEGKEDKNLAQKTEPVAETKYETPEPEEKVAGNTNSTEENTKAPEGNKPLVNTPKKDSRWMFGMRLNTGISYRIIKANTDMVQSSNYTPPLGVGRTSTDTTLLISEYPGIGNGASLLARYALTKKLSLISGIDYSQGTINSGMLVGQFTYTDTVTYNTYSGEFVENSALGEVESKSFGSNDIENLPQPVYIYDAELIPIRYYFRTFEVPLLLRADFKGRHLGWFFEGGPSLRLLHNYYTQVYNNSMGGWDRMAVSNTYTTIQAGTQMHAGISIPVSTKFAVEGGPRFNSMITSLQKEGTRTYLYQLGGSFTAWYRF